MRRRDLVFACVTWGGLLAGLAWALCTQSGWVRESARPIPVTHHAGEDAERPEPALTTATGVVGTVSEDTRAAMVKGFRPVQASAPGVFRAAPAKADPNSAPPGGPR